MILKRLKLYNSIGIKKGIGLDEIEIDFTLFNTGLIGLIGLSGSGKSTILNNLHPFRKVGNKDSDFKYHFYEDGYREFEFEFNGHDYLSQIYIDKAMLFKDDVLLNKTQKVSEYDKCIEEELCSEDIFFKLFFAGKRFKNILELTKGERKQLVIDYLLTDYKKYEKYLDRSKEEKEKLVDKIKRYNVKLEEEDTINKGLEKCLMHSINDKETLNDLKIDLGNWNLEQQEFLKQEKENQKYLDEISKLNEEKRELIGKELQLKETIEENDEKLELLRKQILGKKDKLKNKTIEIIEDDEDDLREKAEELKDELTEYNDKERELLLEKKDLDKEFKRLVEEKEKKVKYYEEVEDKKLPCSKELQLKCILTNNKSNEDLLEKIKEELTELSKKIREITYQTDTVIGKIDKHKENKPDNEKQISEIHNKLNKIKEQKQFKEDQDKIDNWIEQGKEVKAKNEQKKTDLEKLKNKIKDFEDKIEKIRKNIRKDYVDNQEKIKELELDIVRKEEEIKTNKKEIKKYEEQLEELKEIKEKLNKINNRIEQYDVLIKFFGKDGGIIYDLEVAGEEISNVTNELLKNYQNKEIKIKFDTLKENSKGELKEVFDINVSLNGDDPQTYLSDGEGILVSNAVREAMENLRSDNLIKTNCLDELDSSIDQENRVNFCKLLEQGNKLNDRHHTILITHSGEVKSYLTQFIELTDNELKITY